MDVITHPCPIPDAGFANLFDCCCHTCHKKVRRHSLLWMCRTYYTIYHMIPSSSTHVYVYCIQCLQDLQFHMIRQRKFHSVQPLVKTVMRQIFLKLPCTHRITHPRRSVELIWSACLFHMRIVQILPLSKFCVVAKPQNTYVNQFHRLFVTLN